MTIYSTGGRSYIYIVNMILRLLFFLFVPFRKRVAPKGVPNVVHEWGVTGRPASLIMRDTRAAFVTQRIRIMYGNSMMRALCYNIYNTYKRIFDTRFNT